jgi:HEAT repeat protein
VRSAAVATVGIVGEERQTADLVKLLQKAQTPRERGDIEKAILAISGRRGTACLEYLLPLAQSSDSELRMIAFHALASVGGPTALAAIIAGIEDKDESVQDEAVRTLSSWASNWPDDSGVAEPLMKLATSGKKTSHQVLGLRGYLEYVQGDKKLKDDQKVAKVKGLLPMITRAEEKRLAISALSATATGSALELLVAFASDPATTEEACLAIVSTAGKDDLKDTSKELRQKSLQTVLEKSKVDRTKRKAEEVLRRIR